LPISKSERIKAARKRLGISQAELAQRLGIAQSTVARWESGVTPSEEYHDAIHEILGVTLAEPDAERWVAAVREDRNIPFYVRALMLEIRARATSDVALVLMSAYLEDGVEAADLERAIELGQEKGQYTAHEKG